MGAPEPKWSAGLRPGVLAGRSGAGPGRRLALVRLRGRWASAVEGTLPCGEASYGIEP